MRVRSGSDPFPPSPEPRSHYVTCAGFEVHALEWGRADLPPVMMWHGLARNARDFDILARNLAADYRVIAVDQIGRGLSSWSQDPDADYCLARYGEIAEALADALGLKRFHWVGTSMGGALGMHVASGRLRGRIKALLINDIGPTLPEPAVARIRAYAGTPPVFEGISGLEAFMREAYRPFGPHSDAQWRAMAENLMRRLPDGRVTPHYDPAIVRQFEVHPADYEQWEAYDSLTLPVTVLHGIESDLLLPEIAEAMAQRGPKATIIRIDGCGHAPGLNTLAQCALVRDFIEKTGG